MIKEKVFYIFCPLVLTGGPEALHQLCAELSDIGCNAFMYYYDHTIPNNCIRNNVHTDKAIDYYSHYNVKSSCFKTMEDLNKENTVIIFPECLELKDDIFQDPFKGKIVNWFLSCSNKQNRENKKLSKYYVGCQNHEVFTLLNDLPWLTTQNIFMLSDYTRRRFIKTEEDLLLTKRENCILYNPIKGQKHTEKIISLIPPSLNFNFVPIYQMSEQEIIDLGMKSKVYIDFGHHPGKDRVPREMASLGCTVIVGNENVAKNDIDIPIDRSRKIDLADSGEYDYNNICRKIILAVINHNIESDQQQKRYREIIRKEKQVFNQEVQNMIKIL